MSQIKKHLYRSLAVLSCAAFVPFSVRAQSVRAPIDVTSGFHVGAGRVQGFRGTIEGSGLYVVAADFRVGPSTVLTYSNGWRGSLGARVEYGIPGFTVVDVGVFALADVQILGGGRTPATLGFMFDAGGIIRSGVRFTRDFRRDESSWSLQLGVDVVSLLTVLSPRKEYEIDSE